MQHGTHIYVIAATKLWAPILVCIKHIRIFMLGGEGSQGFGPTLKSCINHCKGQCWYCTGNVDISVWWYDFHILLYIFYGDKSLLLLMMFGRMQIRLWDPSILWNDSIPQVERIDNGIHELMDCFIFHWSMEGHSTWNGIVVSVVISFHTKCMLGWWWRYPMGEFMNSL